jgi:hypothetical protein
LRGREAADDWWSMDYIETRKSKLEKRQWRASFDFRVPYFGPIKIENVTAGQAAMAGTAACFEAAGEFV